MSVCAVGVETTVDIHAVSLFAQNLNHTTVMPGRWVTCSACTETTVLVAS
jgi:hypothetical protein